MTRGVIETVKLAIALAFAIPIAVFGLDLLLSGRILIGGVAVLAAVLIVAAEQYVTTPGDLSERVAAAAVGAAVGNASAEVPDPEGRDDAPGDRRDGD